ncbi:MAG: 6-bladed beta-propeller [Tannerella sp.]|jgi:hypothetical protein|nr:6-bladed beta-propeller [Tannerella sp.]
MNDKVKKNGEIRPRIVRHRMLNASERYHVLLFAFVATVSFMGCSSNERKPADAAGDDDVNRRELFYIDVEKAIEKIDMKLSVPISRFVRDVEYIPLETTKQSVFSRWTNRFFTSYMTGKYLIAAMKVFNRSDGTFAFELAQRGQGPGDYLYPTGFAADDEREEFYILDTNGKLMVYDYANHFKFATGAGEDRQMVYLGDGKILIDRGLSRFSSHYTYHDYKVIDVDSTGVQLARHVSSAVRGRENLAGIDGIFKLHDSFCVSEKNKYWNYDGNWYYYESLTDSVFVLNSGFEPEAIGYLNMKELKMTQEQFDTPSMSCDFFRWSISSIGETKDYLFISMYASRATTQESKKHALIYSKKEKTTVAVDIDNIENDIDYGLPGISFWGPILHESSAYTLRFPDDCKDMVRSRKPSVYVSGKAKAFKEMTARLAGDDNDVVCIYHYNE